ncbi:hypothetical protein B0H17DRAFT_1336398 [Mycena rosella]|uniref:Uncharacterized protein n=1 Tax=Mycena rosella TaxID=1033263 RepID=A0AAD7CVN8_MYCRO|nr:hypothetical protein B0H17DRAFT_1336398 [Mycena rosella]
MFSVTEPVSLVLRIVKSKLNTAYVLFFTGQAPNKRPPNWDILYPIGHHSTLVPAGPLQKCGDDEEWQLRRLATARKYRRTNEEDRRKKGREHMRKHRALPTEEQREKQREAQRRYTERFREQIAHQARRAAAKKNTEAGKETKPRPKARQYWSDPELTSSNSEEEEDGW